MSTSVSKAIRLACRAATRVQGGRIRYIRGESSVWIDATFGQSEFQIESANEVRIEHTDRDFLFAVAELILGGQLATPQRGDLIQVEHGDLYKVLPLDGERCYRTAGPGADGKDALYRVHAKRITAAD